MHCYAGSNKLRDADNASFRALNLTYAKDNQFVWVLAGKIKEADAATFEVCDEGRYSLGKRVVRVKEKDMYCQSYVPHGFGKDKNNVYYYDFDGKANIVKKANPVTFKSLNDGYFGHDGQFVFCGFTAIPKAKPQTWGKFATTSFYSKSEQNIYFLNRHLKDADADTFTILEDKRIVGGCPHYAKDKNTAYLGDRIISFAEFDKAVAKEAAFNLETAACNIVECIDDSYFD